jgi:hypothetical protein
LKNWERGGELCLEEMVLGLPGVEVQEVVDIQEEEEEVLAG